MLTRVSTAAFTVDDLLALNDEIAALVRAGIPLERALAELGRELPGRHGRAATALSERLARGASLDEALLESRDEFPRLYVSVVAAGLRSGRLAVALEGLAAAARRVAELRQVTATAIIYPLILFLLAWGLFVAFVVFFAPRVLPGFRDFGVSSAGLIAWLADLGPSARWWAPIGPAVVLLAVVVWWWRSRQALLLDSPRWLGWVPGSRRLVGLCRSATFADVLALLVDQRVPLADGLRLAAAACGDRRMTADAEALAQAIQRGARPAEYLGHTERFPPLVAWFLSAGQDAGLLVSALRHAAGSYHERARQRAEVVQTFVPVLLTLLVGGTSVLVYALLVFAPWANLLKTISLP
ncbi:MAG TPA: type II secretion system F family protein [Pirellulales bacterium]|nr:type II secretion system F family protein [Pirellulales bacterium]